MPLLEDIPVLPICGACNRLFTGFDESTGRLIWNEIWQTRKYQYRRIRSEFEHTASQGCTFCSKLVFHDGRYWRGDFSNNQPTEEVRFTEPRPHWYPSLEEEIVLEVELDANNGSLGFWPRQGVQLVGEPASSRISSLHWKLYAPVDSLVTAAIPQQAVLTDFSSASSFDHVRQHMDKCLTNHERCRSLMPTELPTRLIELSPLGEPEAARLRHSRGGTGSYCALSYCWGGFQPFATTIERYNSYLQRVPFSKMPKTIRDAFQVARHMGMRYIWIDSLCIVQDDHDDVQREIAKMLSIYMGSQFTISAASAMNCNQGFLDKYYDATDGLFRLRIRIDPGTLGWALISTASQHWPTIGGHPQPINERAWTFQESLLTRRLFIFTKTTMLWRCIEGYSSDPEVGINWEDWASHCGYNSPIADQIQDPHVFDYPPQHNVPFDSARAPIWRTWHAAVQLYSGRKLTNVTDKLPAISAVARIFASHLGETYLAGLWKQYLVYDLMWMVSPDARSSSIVIPGNPSWSWAAVQARVDFSVKGRTHYALADILDCHTILANDRAPFGSITSHKLIIKGYLKEVFLSNSAPTLSDVRGKQLFNLWFERDGYPSDGESSPGNDSSTRAWCLALGGTRHEDQNVSVCDAMVIIKSSFSSGCYQRIGYVRGRFPDADPLFRWEECDRVAVAIV
ncbi:HET-domain-containing protein [Byssothecium circinans]|uniref:HET-domain-containing protein n=1 Tax=Byssothecium circinans TaxID=147558 RepID=A0A6A5UHQ8_9PLEO|nr:HET-domain-containing protein [Byssothecium circinans]